MAERSAEAAPDAAPEAPKKKSGKGVIIAAALMLIEGAVMFLLFGMGGPTKTSAANHAEIKDSHEDTTVEVLIAEDKYQNLRTGRVWIWDVAVYAQVKVKNQKTVEEVLERKNAEIQEGIGQIISRAQDAQLKEPERQAINRQFHAFLNKVFSSDKSESPLVEKVLIAKCRGFPADL